MKNPGMHEPGKLSCRNRREPGCSVGCRVTVVIDDGKVTSVFPTGDSENGNLLCPDEKLIPLFSPTG